MTTAACRHGYFPLVYPSFCRAGTMDSEVMQAERGVFYILKEGNEAGIWERAMLWCMPSSDLSVETTRSSE